MAEHDTPTAESGAHSDATGFAHVSVMRDEIVEVLSEVPDGIVVDATLGGAGMRRTSACSSRISSPRAKRY
ncbi:MAG: 16S rRNA (cytosine(1402)-N(4))-methyltransferase [Actinobacteria bacterium]|nr:16S rRNA (cytosine(1402)-N(4))-methyltransferase [Actinomycetota bacterium]